MDVVHHWHLNSLRGYGAGNPSLCGEKDFMIDLM